MITLGEVFQNVSQLPAGKSHATKLFEVG